MVRVCGLDLETTGLDFEKDEVTEVGWIIKDIGDSKPLLMRSVLIRVDSKLLSQDIIDITGISEKHLQRAVTFMEVIRKLNEDLRNYEVEFIVAHNGENFDKPFLEKKLSQRGQVPADHEVVAKPWLDTKADIVYPKRMASTGLTTLAAEHGFLNPFPHQALFDVATMLRVLECYDITKVIARSREPWYTIRAMVSFDNKDEAKKRRYFWENLGNKKYDKCWVKRIKASEMDAECKGAPFEVVILEGQNEKTNQKAGGQQSA